MNKIEFKSDVDVELIDFLGNDTRIAQSAWVSTMGERAEEGDPNRVKGLINFLMRDRHSSPFESCVMQFRIGCPIFVAREIFRHRICSFNEFSARYSEMPPTFYLPPPERNLQQQGSPGKYIFSEGTSEQYSLVVDAHKQAQTTAWAKYQEMLSAGVAKEVARNVLPVSIYTTFYMTINLRSLMNFLGLRNYTADTTVPTFPLWEIQLVARKMERMFADLFPNTYKAFIDNGRVV